MGLWVSCLGLLLRRLQADVLPAVSQAGMGPVQHKNRMTQVMCFYV